MRKLLEALISKTSPKEDLPVVDTAPKLPLPLEQKIELLRLMFNETRHSD